MGKQSGDFGCMPFCGLLVVSVFGADGDVAARANSSRPQ